MTPREKAIVMAFTGVAIGEFNVFHKYVEDKLGYPIPDMLLGSEQMASRVKELSREDFLALHEGE